LVCLYWMGCHKAPTPGRDPTTAQHEGFWLLGFPPGPVHPSLANLQAPDSSRVSMLMPGLVWTPSRHRPLGSRTPTLKASSTLCLQVAGLQEHATTPSENITSLFALLNRAPSGPEAVLSSLTSINPRQMD